MGERGESAPADKVAQLILTFKGDQVRINGRDAATIKLDATKTPSAVDFVDTSDKADRGVYILDGDTLTFCMALAESGKDRPTVFASTKENGFMLIVLKRQLQIDVGRVALGLWSMFPPDSSV